MIKSFSFLLFLFAFISSQAQAALLVEPMLGHNFGGKIDLSGENNYSGGNGLAYGGRVGWEKFGFMVAADYLHSSVEMHDSDFGDKVKTDEFAGILGYRLPILLKLYAGYIVNARGTTQYQVDTSTSPQGTTLKSGHGYKVGAGWTLLPLVDLNLEYRSITFDSWRVGGDSRSSDVDLGMWLFSVSMPFHLFE